MAQWYWARRFLHPVLGTPLPTPAPNMRAAWLYHGRWNAWTWSPIEDKYAFDLDRLSRLIANGYARVPDSISPSLLTLYGQMCSVITLALPSGKGREHWARQQDLDRLEAVPVALAFTLPDEMMAAWEPLLEDSPISTPDSPHKYLRMAQRLPPPGIGERALVWRGGNDWQTRTIASLGDEGRQIQDRMAAVLRDLAEPASWRPWLPALDACQDAAQYERLKAEMRSDLLAKRGNERELVRENLELLEAVRAHALDIQAFEARQMRNYDAWIARVAEVVGMAQQLADLYWHVEQEAERHASRLNLPDVPNVFDSDGMVAVSSPMPVQAVLNAFSAAAKGWPRDDSGVPTYRQTTREHDTIIQVRGDDPAEMLDDARLQQLYRLVGELSDLDGDVFLAMLAQYMASPADPNGVWITASQILDYRGIEPKTTRDENGRERRAGHRREDLQRVAACVARQASQWVRVNSVVIEDTSSGKAKKQRWTHSSKLTQIIEDISQQDLLPEPGQPGSLSLAWRYRIGTWLDRWISGPNRQMAYLCQQALRYDPYHDQWEKRLARYFVFHLRINAAREPKTITRNIGRLIDELSLDVPLDERNPERKRQRFQQALDTLVHDTVIDGWEYAKDNPDLPPRKWLATWREWNICVHAGAITRGRQAQIAERAQTRRDRRAALQEGRAKRTAKDGKSTTKGGGRGPKG